MHALDAVKIGLDDKLCHGVTSPDGRRRYDARDGVVTVPRYEAERLLRSGGPAGRVTGGIAANRPVLESHQAYDAYCAAHGWMPYMRWYRTVDGKEELPCS